MTPTERYIREHKEIFSLPMIDEISLDRKKVVIGHNLKRLFLFRSNEFFRALKSCLMELIRGRKFLYASAVLSGSGANRNALLIGNGPSQGLISVDELNYFKSLGNDTYCVNYWSDNNSLSSHIPSYMVFSDPNTFNIKDPRFSSRAERLLVYLNDNPSIKLVVPFSQIMKMKKIVNNQIYGFVDTEFSGWSNINIFFPRGYISMTLYKALAWAKHLNYKKIYILGMDNTYPRNLYNSRNNHPCSVFVYGGCDDFVADLSPMYESVASVLDEMVRLFDDLRKFKAANIFNIDLNSLTDAFQKIDKDTFLKSMKS